MTARKQYLASVAAVVSVSAVCYVLSPYLGYRVIALVLLLAVSIIAVMFDILPVLLAAALSAFIWDFFFIPPRFTFHIHGTEDRILLIMYFVIATISAVLTYRIRKAETLARQKEEKANAVRLYDTLLNSLSHEMRTPIATIIAATDNLQDRSVNLSADDKAQLTAEIATAAFRLNKQVENVLSISRLESGIIKPKKDWCDISEIVHDTVKKLEEVPVQQKISININPHIPLFRSDKVMLEQVIYNLLANAMLYTPPGSVINISAACHADVLEIIIEDNGPGFPENEIEHVFDKFYRLSGSKPGGTGLGLSIVKGFTEALGGNVSLRNVPGGGAGFTIRIPGETSYLKA